MRLLVVVAAVVLAAAAVVSAAGLADEIEHLRAHEFGEGYVQAVQIGEAMRAHVEKGTFDNLPKGDEWQVPATSFLEMDTKLGAGEGAALGGVGGGLVDSGSLATYLPSEGPYDNPATDTTPTPTLPSTPTCTIRGQTVFEIRKMRADAKQIGMSIMYEIQVMEKRKAYIEQMTAYLNDRIRELNKVKRDLNAEQKWIQLSNQRIAELAQKERLIKLQDVMSCINTEREKLQGEGFSKQTTMTAMSQQAATLEANINSIRQRMKTISGPAGAAGMAGAPVPGEAAPAL